MKENKGVALIVAYFVIAVLIVIGAAFLSRSIYEKRAADKERDVIRARYIAEAGLERALFDLKQDYLNDSTDPNWTDGDINGMTPSLNGILPYATSTPNNQVVIQLVTGSYSVQLIDIGTDKVTILSTGTYEGVSKKIRAHVRIFNVSPWNTAIFAGAGASGSTISGNVHIRGSVIILGLNLNHTDTAIALSGSASLGNNYEGMPVELSSRVPALPTLLFNGETVQSLNANLWVRKGKVDLSGSATVGQQNVTDNSIKETMDGIYIDVGEYDGSNSNENGTYYDGFGGNKGPINVYSDNGTTNQYPLGNSVTFPDLAGSSEYNPSINRKQWLTQNSLHISESTVSNISSATPDFSYSAGTNSISWNQATGILTDNGIVEITDTNTEPGGLSVGADGVSTGLSIGDRNSTVLYTGNGTIFAKNIYVHGNLLSNGTFPTTTALGMIAQNNMELAAGPGDAQLKMIGAFYANNQIISTKQNEIAGTFVANYFNMGTNVPKIYQVPALKDHLPPGLPRGTTTYIIITENWQEL